MHLFFGSTTSIGAVLDEVPALVTDQSESCRGMPSLVLLLIRLSSLSRTVAPSPKGSGLFFASRLWVLALRSMYCSCSKRSSSFSLVADCIGVPTVRSLQNEPMVSVCRSIQEVKVPLPTFLRVFVDLFLPSPVRTPLLIGALVYRKSRRDRHTWDLGQNSKSRAKGVAPQIPVLEVVWLGYRSTPTTPLDLGLAAEGCKNHL